MILSWCIIIKDDSELPKLKKAVESVIDHVDEIVITANGEKTSEIETYCRQYPKIKYAYLKWNDNFAEQRNFCASHIHPDADYYGWMDTDDVLINAHLLRDVAKISHKNEYDAVFFDYWYGNRFDGEPSPETYVETELNQKRERLLKPNAVTWKKRIHETPVPVDGASFKYTQVPYSKDWPIVWMHLGADRDLPEEALKAKTTRNRRLLELELAEEREHGEADPRTILYLMKIYAEEDDEETLRLCVEMGREYLQKSGWDQERALCLQLMSKCVGKLNGDREARDFLYGAIKEYPYNPLLYLYLARAYFNLGNFRAMKHWMQMGLSLPVEENNGATNNILEMKILSAELMLEYYLRGERDIRKAYDAAKLLNILNPTENNKHNEEYLSNQKELDIASEHAHKLMDYLREIRREELIPLVVEAMPHEMKRLPFANRYYNRFKKPRVWQENEICYYANFGGEHFEKWDGGSLSKGIGGSETAVIRLAEEWTKLGFRVIVYGDPLTDCEINGVTYLPFYKFNIKDRFNIFIQWRHSTLADKVNAKKFLVDLHDVFFAETHMPRVESVDRFMVKSDYHRSLGKKIPGNKFSIVSNGI